MPSIPIAAFLAGALLSLLLPTLLLTALVVWYWLFIRRVPDSADRGESGAARESAPSAAPGTDPPPREA